MNRKILSAVIFLTVILGLYFLTPLKDLLSQNNLENLKSWIQAQGAWAPFIYIVLYSCAVVFALPGSVLTLLGGLIFGIFWGVVLVTLSANLGALLAFWVARFLGRDVASKLLRGRIQNLNEGIGQHGFYVVLWTRLIPIFPFNVLNYAFGLTDVKTKDYFFGNILGMFPGTFVYVSLGNAASKVSLTDPKVWTQIEVWGPFVLVIILSFLPKLFRKKQKELKEKLK